ncbi:MAG: tetratricopeptide repeat protein [Candidatus Omnitrophica bacterium]|nr:tetratricopeptide repeat protein [Candidatus Omnitrophota bacterium]
MRISRFSAIVLLILITFFTFSNALRNGFVNWDDDRYVSENPVIRTATCAHIAKIFSSLHIGLYIPATMFTYMADYQLWRNNPFGYHLTSLFIHIVNVLLVFLFLELLGLGRMVSFAAALIFAIHPVQVESVVWISERKAVLCVTFFLLSFFAYIRYFKKGLNRFYVYSLILFLLALLSKSSVVVLPLLLIAYDYFYGTKTAWRGFKDKIPYFLLAFFFSVLTVCSHYNHGKSINIYGGSIGSHVITTLSIFMDYLRLVFCPVHLSIIYDPKVYTSILSPKVLFALIILGYTFLCFVYAARKREASGFWILWFLVLMLPVLNIVPFFRTYNERYLYLPVIAFPVLLFLAEKKLFKSEQIERYTLIFIFTALVPVLALLSYQRNMVWKDSFALWQDALKTAPSSHVAHFCMGIAYEGAGNYNKAIEEYKVALKANPDFPRLLANLGIAYEKSGMIKEAIELDLKAIKLDPKSIIAYNDLGVCYAKQGRVEDAIRAYERAIEVNPEYDKAYNNISIMYLRKGWVDKAIEACKKALSISPEYARAYNSLGNAYFVKKDYDEALSAYRKALEIAPELGEARENLEHLRKFLKGRS